MCILHVHKHIFSLYICSIKNTSADLDMLHWLQASLSKEASTALGKSIHTQQERTTGHMALRCMPVIPTLQYCPIHYVAVWKRWLKEDLTYDVLCE